MLHNDTLIILIRNPLKGLVKSRLAAEAGIEKAYRIYKQLLTRLHSNTISLPYRKCLFYDRYIDTDDYWNEKIYEKYLQSEGDIGKRMKEAIKQAFGQGADKVVLIGSDTPEIDEIIIAEAFRSLDAHDIILGPANDGGYYLIAMKKAISKLFDIEKWGGNLVLKQTIQQINKLQLSYKLLPELIDIDTIEDLNKSGFDQWQQDQIA